MARSSKIGSDSSIFVKSIALMYQWHLSQRSIRQIFSSLHKDGPETLMLYYCKKEKIEDWARIKVELKILKW